MFANRHPYAFVPPLAVLLVSAGSLGYALYAQYVQKILPCLLCYYQRIPFYVAGGLAILALLALRQAGLSRFLVYLCGLAFAAGSAIAIYHVGVQHLWWEGPEMCGGLTSGANSVADLKAQLMDQPIVRCDKIDWGFFGISMPTINVFYSAVLAILCFVTPSRWMK
jgi:disulfide bond formation protein DsbB